VRPAAAAIALLLALPVAGPACGRTDARGADAPATGLARVALGAPGVRWDSVVAPALTLYLRPGSHADLQRDALAARLGASLRHALELLGEPAYPARLRVFALESREEMARVTGRSHNGTTDAPSHAVLLVANAEWSPFDRHELMHAASLTLWGEPGGARAGTAEWARGGWLREGIAAAAEDRCGPYRGRAVAAAMQAGGERLSIAELTGHFYERDDLSAYLQAGSLVQFLLETRGREPFRRLWREGPDALERVYGRPADALDAEWRAWLAATPAETRPPSLAELRRAGCGASDASWPGGAATP
jgi:hypothetical protein